MKGLAVLLQLGLLLVLLLVGLAKSSPAHSQERCSQEDLLYAQCLRSFIP